jgi:hypothetical protein
VSDINLVTITVEEIPRLTTFFAGGRDKFHEQNILYSESAAEFPSMTNGQRVSNLFVCISYQYFLIEAK